MYSSITTNKLKPAVVGLRWQRDMAFLQAQRRKLRETLFDCLAGWIDVGGYREWIIGFVAGDNGWERYWLSIMQ